MEIVIANKYEKNLSGMDIDVIKSLVGQFEVDDLGEMLRNFVYDKMVIDVTALVNYDDFNVYHDLAQYFDPDKMIFLLPGGTTLCTPNFLIHLIQDGIYNFTTSVGGVAYLLKKGNTYADIEHIVKMATPKEPDASTVTVPKLAEDSTDEKTRSPKKSTIIGFKNITDSGGATTLIYMIKKELAMVYGQESVIALEIDKSDFLYFFDKRMISTKQVEIKGEIEKYKEIPFILVDLNGCKDFSFCDEVIYLIEPSTLKLNRLMRRDAAVFQSLANKKIVLNQSVLLSNDVADFEKESGIRVFYNMPALDERKRNSAIADFLTKLGVIGSGSAASDSGKIFGLFRR